MGALWAVVGILVVVVAIGATVIVRYVTASSRSSSRDVAYKKAMVALENKKARGILEKDDFAVHQADREAVALRDRYVAGKDIPFG